MKKRPHHGGAFSYCGIISVDKIENQFQQLAVMDPFNHPDDPFPVIVIAHNGPPFVFDVSILSVVSAPCKATCINWYFCLQYCKLFYCFVPCGFGSGEKSSFFAVFRPFQPVRVTRSILHLYTQF